MAHINAKATSGKTYVPRVRYINGLTIYFATKDTIFITDTKVAIVLERWFDNYFGFYKDNWKPLVEVLTKKQSLRTVYEVWNLADKYDVARHQTFRFPEIKSNTIVVKDKKC